MASISGMRRLTQSRIPFASMGSGIYTISRMKNASKNSESVD